MDEQSLAWTMFAGFGIVLGAMLIFMAKRSSAIQVSIAGVVRTFGWRDERRLWLIGRGVRGVWNGYEVRVEHKKRYKGIPERLTTRIRAASPGTIIIKRRGTVGFLSKPLTLFGAAPLVEPANFPQRDAFWIRSDETMFAEKLFIRGTVAPLLDANLVAPFDELRIKPRVLTITRALDLAAVRKKFGRGAFEWKYDLPRLEAIVREEWELGKAVVDILSLRPQP
jgi:hypothetical protein